MKPFPIAMQRCLLAVFEMALVIVILMMEMEMEMAVLHLVPDTCCLGVEVDQGLNMTEEGLVSLFTVPTPNTAELLR